MKHITPSLEDYLEQILMIIGERKIARVRDIAKGLSVKEASVNNAIRILKEAGLITHEPYEQIELTRKGIRVAKNILKRHRMLKSFFRSILGVDERTATRDACKIEHYLSQKTTRRLFALVEFLGTCTNCDKFLNSGFGIADVKGGER